MPLSGIEAQERALKMLEAMGRLSKELGELMHELPLPTLEEFEAMRSNEVPWPFEAYIAAVIRNAEFHIDEARVILNDYASESERRLCALWKKHLFPAPHLERSLRYLVEVRSGQKIAPSQRETLYYKPHAAIEALVGALLA
jgi:hypothetical protein